MVSSRNYSKPFSDSFFCMYQNTFQLKSLMSHRNHVFGEMFGIEPGTPVGKVIGEIICVKVVWEIHGCFFISDDYPSLHVGVSERAVHGHWVFIYLIPAHSSGVPINIQRLGAREEDRGQVIWWEARGERAQGQSRAQGFICAAWWFVVIHTETNVYGKLEETPL